MDNTFFNMDISPLLADWEYRADEVTVRLVDGVDGKPKIQMRLPMGLIQMEIDGRPDGMRPEGFESYLDYYEAVRRESPERFVLDPEACSLIRDEATMYYHRYLSLFHLKDFVRCARDTERNIRSLDFVKQHAEDSGDRIAFEQYRPYIIMMNARSRTNLQLEQGLRAKALEEVREGIARIESFLHEIGQEKLVGRSPELEVLRQLENEIKEQVPAAKIEDLRIEMDRAIKSEDFERAAEIRDEIRRIEEMVQR